MTSHYFDDGWDNWGEQPFSVDSPNPTSNPNNSFIPNNTATVSATPSFTPSLANNNINTNNNNNVYSVQPPPATSSFSNFPAPPPLFNAVPPVATVIPRTINPYNTPNEFISSPSAPLQTHSANMQVTSNAQHFSGAVPDSFQSAFTSPPVNQNVSSFTPMNAMPSGSNSTYLPPPSVTSHPVPMSVVSPTVINSNNSNLEGFYPENRERPDDLLPVSVSSPSAPIIERTRYMVTGHLSQDPTLQGDSNQEHHSRTEQHNESEQRVPEALPLPPPGLSRLVVGEPENNQEQAAFNRNDVLPSGLNRLVTGTEMSPSNYINYQRQADGEVSHNNYPIRPPSNSSYAPPQHQNVSINQIEDPSPVYFNISDRNLYLVAGESDSQRVIPGVESDNSNMQSSVINPLQNLHIEDDEDFVNVAVTTQQNRIIGNEEQQSLHQNLQRSFDPETREEDIEGANDSNNVNTLNVNAMSEHFELIDQEAGAVAVREESIEGANDYQQNVPTKPSGSREQPKFSESTKKQKSDITLSSEDSEIRNVDRHPKMQPKKNKRFDSNDSESENLDEYKNKKDKYDERSRRYSREKMSREDYEKYRRREKEKRSGGKPKRGDEADSSKYPESKRRTDDEEERRVRDKYKRDSRSKNESRDDVEESDRRKDKNRDPRKKDYYDDQERRERRRRNRDRDRDRYYEESSGRRSQNTSDREYDRYMRTRTRGYDSQGYYPQYPGGYNHQNYNYNTYYQQQAYLESLRHTNPPAYEWYKNYYSLMMQQTQMPQQPSSMMDDIGGSLRSGYSSSNEKDRASTSKFLPGGSISNPLKSLNSSFIDNNDYNQMHSFQPFEMDVNQGYPSLNFTQNYGHEKLFDARNKGAVTGRVTPKKFQSLHGLVRLTNGLITTLNTANVSDGYIVKIENVAIHDKNKRLYQSFPGPLVRGVSHKRTVIEFCEDKMKQTSRFEHGMHRASYALLWSYLILMLRQNGVYTEGDIAELLMKNSEEYVTSLDGASEESKQLTNNDNTDASDIEENDTTSERNLNSASRETSQITSSAMSEKNILLKFKSYLLYGNINDALDFAADNNLWGHALFLASKVDKRQHANVMLKFANKLPYNDPLQTLYQIMSGRMPSCVTNLDDKWGDWRPHLAMIISNCTDKPELVKRSITALGDSLATRGDIFGSQFCYLLVDPTFTDFTDKSNGKISLLGTTAQKPFKEFSSDENIVMTEIYEYARSLSNDSYYIAPLQKYKYLLASNMLDYGLQLKCLLYMEQISKCILRNPDLFESSFVSKIYALSDRLKFYDPVIEKYEDNFNNNSNDIMEDQKWLQDLQKLVVNQSSLGYVEPQLQQQPHQQIYEQIPTYQQNQLPIQLQPTYGNSNPASQHQTPVHAPYNQMYDENMQLNSTDNQVSMSGYQQDTSFEQYQHDQQNYSTDYNSTIGNSMNNMQFEKSSNDVQAYDSNSNISNANYQEPSQNDYDYSYNWNQPTPNISLGNIQSKKFEEDAREEKKASNAKDENNKNEPEKKKAQTQNSNTSGKGWFGGLFSFKPKNQMILPDDKNPAIVWDEKAKKWVNKVEDSSEVESFKPPPKLGEMAGNNMPQPPVQTMEHNPPSNAYQPVPQQVPVMQQNNIALQNRNANNNNSTATLPISQPQQMASPQLVQEVSNAAPNMFKMQKGRNLKKSYVEVLGNAGQTVSQPKDLGPQMDMQFFNAQPQQPMGMQFYNPNDFH